MTLLARRDSSAYPSGIAFPPSQILPVVVDKRAQLGDRSTADSARAVVFAGLASPHDALLGFVDAKAVQLRAVVGVPRRWSFRRMLGERVQRRRVVLDLQRVRTNGKVDFCMAWM